MYVGCNGKGIEKMRGVKKGREARRGGGEDRDRQAGERKGKSGRKQERNR